jgi:hypothetical protein
MGQHIKSKKKYLLSPGFALKTIGKSSHRFWGLFLAINLLTACASYEKMLVSALVPGYTRFYRAGQDLRQLARQKAELDSTLSEIVLKIKREQAKPEAIHANEINNLFENLKNQFQIDLAFQAISDGAPENTRKSEGWANLAESAVFYSHVFREDKFLRRIINRGDAAHDVPPNLLLRSQKFLWNRKNQEKIKEQQLTFSLNEQDRKRFAAERRNDGLFNLKYKIIGFGSKIVSLLVSAIHQKAHPEANINRVLPLLQKWDIICQKSPGRLSDKIIPGYFGHSGIYTGDSIFAEVIAPRARFSSSLKFLEGEEFLVIRPLFGTENQTEEMEGLLKGQIGKKYDFNYNVESPDLLTCTELIYLVYDQVAWQTRKIAGRFMIPPDCLVRTALNGEKLRVQYYIDRERIIEMPDLKFVEELLERR